MISSIGAQAWSAADLTGNSALVTVGSTRYVAGGGYLHASTDYGLTWAPLVALPVSTDPALAVDSEGNVHILMAVATVGSEALFDVVKYVYNTTTKVLSAPLTLVHGTRTVSAYDLCSLTAGRVLAVATALEPVGHTGYYCLMAFEVEPDGAFSTVVLQQNHWATGDTFGSITLAGDGELYYTSHSRVFPFKETDVLVLRALRSAVDTWGSPEQIGAYPARYTDDKLTVLALASGQRILVQAYHRWSRARGLYTNILYGVGTALGPWSWVNLEATDESDLHEPVVETDGTSVYLAYLRNSRLYGTTGYSRSGTLEISVLDPSTRARTVLSGSWSAFTFRWLRGTKEVVDPDSKWMFIGIQGTETGESDGGMATFFSQYNLAPTAHLVPSTVTLQRGVPLVLDASGTVDPDLDSLTYTWVQDHTDAENVHLTPSGNRAVLLVDKAIGPLATSLTVTVTATDGVTGHESSASCTVTVPSNSEPVIVLDETMAAPRNTAVLVPATVTDGDRDDLTYQWSQESGTPVELVGATSPEVTALVYRMSPQGEDVVLRLTVQDGVNRPIFKAITLTVPPIPGVNVDDLALTRRFYRVGEDAATLSQRNAATGFWPSYSISSLKCNLQRMRITANLDGKERFVYVGGSTVLSVSQDETEVFYRAVTPPVEGEKVLDGAQDEIDQMYVLTDQGRLYCYATAGPDGCSDWPDASVSLGDLVSGSYTRLEVGRAYAGKRVLALYGGTGLLLLQVYSDGLQVLDVLQISVASGGLPSDNIGFLRMDNVLGLKGGQILIGMWDSTETLEALYDLSVRRVVRSWDRTSLISSVVTTGEILVSSDLTSGIPDAPILQEPELLATNRYRISWTQSRPDLISGYEVWLGVDAAQPSIYAALPGGSIRRVDLPTKAGHVYHITARSQGASGMSAFSSERTLTT